MVHFRLFAALCKGCVGIGAHGLEELVLLLFLGFDVSPNDAIGSFLYRNAVLGQEDAQCRLVLPMVFSGGSRRGDAILLQGTILPRNDHIVVDEIVVDIDQRDAGRSHPGMIACSGTLSA